jgi:superfamily II DNA or RNA helicase
MFKKAQALAYGSFNWYAQKYGDDAYRAHLVNLRAQIQKSILFKSPKGTWWTYSGLAPELSVKTGLSITTEYEVPETGSVYLESPLPELRYYQKQALEVMLAKSHAAVELATGSGKSLLLIALFKAIGLPGVLLVPTTSIAEQMYSVMARHFGTRHVGKFFGTKKESGKRFVVAISNSVRNVKPDSEHFENFKLKKLFAVDESHLTPAESLAAIVTGPMFRNAPYRYFVSGTQMRSDGLDIVLRGITGPVLMEVGVEQLVKEGFLCPLKFFQFKVKPDQPLKGMDPIEINREGHRRNGNVYRKAAEIIESGLRNGRRPLVLCEEIPQFEALMQHLKIDEADIGFAHGGVNANSKKALRESKHSSDPGELVEAFDSGKLKVLVGTQCIGTGTDIKSASLIVDVVGLASETRIRQNVGRGTRLHDTKKDCIYVDFCVTDGGMLEKHAAKRRGVFDSIYGTTQIR